MVYPKFDTGAKENLWRAALWPPLLYISNHTFLNSFCIFSVSGTWSKKCGPDPVSSDHLFVRRNLHHGRHRQRGGLPRHRQEQVDAHGHQLLPLLTRYLRSHDSCSR